MTKHTQSETRKLGDVSEREAVNSFEETHEMKMLKYEQHIRMSMFYTNAGDVDPSTTPDGMTRRWARDTCMGQHDETRIPELMAKGWEPVRASAFPEHMKTDLMGRHSHLNGYKNWGGLIMMERPERLTDVERECLREYNTHLTTTLPGAENLLNDPNVPAKDLSKFCSY